MESVGWAFVIGGVVALTGFWIGYGIIRLVAKLREWRS